MKISIKTISFYLKQYKKLRPSQKETQEKNHWRKPKVQKKRYIILTKSSNKEYNKKSFQRGMRRKLSGNEQRNNMGLAESRPTDWCRKAN